MIARFRRGEVAVIISIITVALIAACAAGCEREKKHHWQKHGVSLWQVGAPQTPSGGALKAQKGDWILASSNLKLVIAGNRDDHQKFQKFGSIVRVAVNGVVTEDLRELKRAVRIDDKERPISVTAVNQTWRKETPAVRIDSIIPSIALKMTTVVEIDTKADYVVITTWITNQDRSPIRAIQLGDSALWPDDLTFAPGLGYINAPTRALLPWIARRGRKLSYALAFPNENTEVDFNFLREGPIDQIAVTPRFNLAPGKTKSYKRLLIAKRADLGRVAETAWTESGYKIGHVKGTVKPVPTWGTVEASTSKQGPQLIVSVLPNGAFTLPLPYGKYTIRTLTPGGVDTQSIALSPERPDATVEMLSPEAGMISYKIVDAKGNPIPARLIVQGIAPTKNPVFGPSHVAQGTGNVIATSKGTGEIEIARGRYRVTVTRGIEYSVVRRELTVDEKKGAVMRAQLKKMVDTRDWIASDLHLHAAPSYDSELSIEDRVKSLMAEGIRFAVATDHNTITDYSETVTRLGGTAQLTTATGVEVTTVEPTWGHFNVWPVAPTSAPPPFAGISPATLFEYIRREAPEALIQVNHPWMKEYGIGYFDIAQLNPTTGRPERKEYSPAFDVIEVVNGYELNRPERVETNLQTWFDLLNLERRYAATGGSDSHRMVWQTAGYPRTYIRIPEGTGQDEIIRKAAEAVRAGHTLITTGPFIRLKVAGGDPGDLVTAKKGRVTIDVAVSAPNWIDVDSLEVVSNGERIITSTVRATRNKIERTRLSLRLPVSKDSWVVAVARGKSNLIEVLPYVEALPFAFTNPVYVDVDGDGKFTAPGNS